MLVMWVAGAGVCTLWLAMKSSLDWRVGIAGLALALAGLAIWPVGRQTPSGNIRWDGDLWQWQSALAGSHPQTCEVHVIADFQRLLLLRLDISSRRRCWFWTGQEALPERWMDLRRALYSPHKSVISGLQGNGSAPETDRNMAVSTDDLFEPAPGMKP